MEGKPRKMANAAPARPGSLTATPSKGDSPRQEGFYSSARRRSRESAGERVGAPFPRAAPGSSRLSGAP